MPEPLRIWNIHSSYLCPIVGYSLNQKERASLVKKSEGVSFKALDGIEFHEKLVAALGKEGSIAERAERLLDRKYAKDINAHANDDFTTWYDAAENYLCAEGFGAFIWISARYALFTDKENDKVYGLIHMYTHEIRDELLRERKLSAFKEKDIERLAESLKGARQRIRSLESELVGFRKSAMTSSASALSRQAAETSSNMAHATATEIDTASLTARARRLEIENEELREINRRLSVSERDSIEWLDKAKADMERLFAALSKPDLGRPTAACDACGSGNPCDLCERRVLVVGGISRLKVIYRELVAKMNGSFLYHDGNSHTSGLPELIKQADVVLCPVDVNSHAACLKVKRVCKDSGKDFYMLRKSSVSSVYETLSKVACG